MAHTAAFHQLPSLLRINSFPCRGIAPRIDWFHLPAFLGRAWKGEKSAAPRLPSHLFIISFPRFGLLFVRLLLYFSFPLYLHFKREAPASGISAEKPEPVLPPLPAGAPPRSRLGRQEGHYRNAEHSQLPASAGSTTGSLESRRNPTVVIFVLPIGFARFLALKTRQRPFYLLIEETNR